MKHHYGWIIILLGALIVACTSPSPKTEQLTKDTAVIVYETGLGGMRVRKIKVDGQEYLIASNGKGICIVQHFSRTTIDSAGWGDIIVGSGTVRSLTPKEQKEIFEQ